VRFLIIQMAPMVEIGKHFLAMYRRRYARRSHYRRRRAPLRHYARRRHYRTKNPVHSILSAVNRLHRQHVHAEQLQHLVEVIPKLEKVLEPKGAAGRKLQAAAIVKATRKLTPHLNAKAGVQAAGTQVCIYFFLKIIN